MLGGSPRGGDGTNVVLNEGSARWLGVCIGKPVPVVVVACGVRPVYSPRLGGSPEPKIFGRWLVAWDCGRCNSRRCASSGGESGMCRTGSFCAVKFRVE